MTARVSVVLRHSFAPIFAFNGEIVRKYKIAEVTGDGEILLVPAGEGERGDAWVFPARKSDRNIAQIIFEIDLKKLPRSIVDHSSIVFTPDPWGLRVAFGREPDPGREPQITPVFIKRFKFRSDKKIAGRRAAAAIIIRSYHEELIEAVARHKFTALSHAGGSLFKLVRDPFERRAVYFPLALKSGRGLREWRYVYIVIYEAVAARMGFLGASWRCADFIRDVAGDYYFRLVPSENCQGEG